MDSEHENTALPQSLVIDQLLAAQDKVINDLEALDVQILATISEITAQRKATEAPSEAESRGDTEPTGESVSRAA